MVSITFIAQLSSLKSLFDLTESATTASQSAVNKVASTLFEDTSTEIGYAVLQQRCTGDDHNAQPLNVLLRYNTALQKIFDQPLAANGENGLSQDADHQQDFQKDKEAMASKLLGQLTLLGSERLKVNLGQLLADLSQNQIDDSEKTGKHVVVNAFFTKQKGQERQMSGILKHQSLSMLGPKVLRVSVSILNSSKRLFLVKVFKEQHNSTSQLIENKFSFSPKNDKLMDAEAQTEMNGCKSPELVDSSSSNSRLVVQREIKAFEKNLRLKHVTFPSIRSVSGKCSNQMQSSSIEESEREPIHRSRLIENATMANKNRLDKSDLPQSIELRRPSFKLLPVVKTMPIGKRYPPIRTSNRRLLYEDKNSRSQKTMDTHEEEKVAPAIEQFEKPVQISDMQNDSMLSLNSLVHKPDEVLRNEVCDLLVTDLNKEPSSASKVFFSFESQDLSGNDSRDLEIYESQSNKMVFNHSHSNSKSKENQSAREHIQGSVLKQTTFFQSSSIQRIHSEQQIFSSLPKQVNKKTTRKKSSASSKSTELLKSLSLPFMFSTKRRSQQLLLSQSAKPKKSGVSSLSNHDFLSTMNKKFKLSDQINEKSLAQKSSSRSHKSKNKNDRTFVYKIIHDLRHPTEALTYAIQTLIDQTCDKKKDSRSSSQMNFSDSNSKVKRHSSRKVARSLSRLEHYVSRNKHKHENRSHFAVRRRRSSQHLLRFGQNLSARRKNKIKIEQKESSRKERSNSQPCSLEAERVGRILIDKNSDKELPNNIQDQSQLIQKIHLQDELNKEENLQQESVSNSDASSIVISDTEEHNNICFKDYSSVSPSVPNFKRRDNQIEQHGNQSSIEEQKARSPYKIYSLAIEKLVDNISQSYSRDQRSEYDVQSNDKSIKLRNVNKVIDQFKQESMQLRKKDEFRQERMNQILSKEPMRDEKQLSDGFEQSLFFKNRHSQLLSCPIAKYRKESSGLLQSFSSQYESSPDIINQAQNSDEISEKSKLAKERLAKDIRCIILDHQALQQKFDALIKSRREVRFWLINMQTSAQMMLSLQKDLMNQAQLANNTFTMVDGFFDLRNIIQKCIRQMDINNNTKSINMQGPIIANPLDKYYFKQVFSDERRYVQIIYNFLSNGIKFTPASGTVKISLSVIEVQDIKKSDQDKNIDESSSQSAKSAPDKEMLPMNDEKSSKLDKVQQCEFEIKLVSFQLVFSDSGCGISSERREKLFKNFSKLKETQHKNQAGVGLGLSICKDIIQAYGGSIDIQSTVGQGTDFIISMQAKCKIDIKAIEEAKAKLERQGYLTASEKCLDDNSQQLESRQSSSGSSSQSHSSASFSYRLGLSQVDESEGDYSKDSREISQSDSSKNSKQYSRELKSFRNLERQQKGVNSTLVNNIERDKNMIDASGIDAKIEKGKCLLANDSQFLLMAFQDRLKEHFEKVETFENGLLAVDAVKAQQVDYYQAIVLDISMPIMNGIEACILIMEYFREMQPSNQRKKCANSSKDGLLDDQKVNQVESHLPRVPFVYALTSESEPEVIEQIKKAGFKRIFHQLDNEVMSSILQECGREPLQNKKRIQARDERVQSHQNQDGIPALDESKEHHNFLKSVSVESQKREVLS